MKRNARTELVPGMTRPGSRAGTGENAARHAGQTRGHSEARDLGLD